MEHAITLVFPHQLFQTSPAIDRSRRVYLIESPRFFSSFSFHKQKLVLHRASMKAYEQFLSDINVTVSYIEHAAVAEFWRTLQVREMHYIDTVDHEIEQELARWAKHHAVVLIKYTSPAFLTPISWLEERLHDHTSVRLYPFYCAQRKRMDILIDAQGKPMGGKWSF